jgi:hypothetical protein
MEVRELRGQRGAETPVNAAKFTMARDCVPGRFQRALIGTYKRLILGANSAVSDFRGALLQACTGARYKFLGRGVREDRRNRFRRAERLKSWRANVKSAPLDASFEPNSLAATLNHRCGETLPRLRTSF